MERSLVTGVLAHPLAHPMAREFALFITRAGGVVILPLIQADRKLRHPLPVPGIVSRRTGSGAIARIQPHFDGSKDWILCSPEHNPQNINMMLTKIQQLMNMSQQLLNDNHAVDVHGKDRTTLKIDENNPGDASMMDVDQHDNRKFLASFDTLFRRSTLALIVTLGRKYTMKFHVRDLSRSLSYDVSMISKNLKYLEKKGLVNHEDVGNLVLYQANMDSVLLRHMKICFTLLELNELLRSLEPLASNIVLFGSCADGEDTTESDIDLFIETMDTDAVKQILDSHQEHITRTLSPIIATSNDTYVMKAKDRALYASIQQGVILKGGEHVPSL